MKNILVPVGSKESGINNLQYAINFAAMSGAKVYLINIYKAFSKVGGLTKVNLLMMDDSEALLDDLLSQVDTKGIEVIAKPVQGDPFEAISRISKQLNIDLLILSPQSVEKRDEVYLGHITGKIAFLYLLYRRIAYLERLKQFCWPLNEVILKRRMYWPPLRKWPNYLILK